MRLKGVLEALGLVALVAVAGFGLSFLSRTYELGSAIVPLFIFGGGLVIGAVLLYRRRHLSTREFNSKVNERPLRLSLTQYVGLFVAFVGLILGLGNITGVMPTISNAGSVVAAIGAVIYGLAGSKK